MKPHHFSSQTHDRLKEENEQLKKNIEALNKIVDEQLETNQKAIIVIDTLKARIKELEERNEFFKKENEALEQDLTERNECVQTLVKKVKELEASQHKWISVEERLPKNSGIFWVFDPILKTETKAYFDADVGKFCDGITHWMLKLLPPTTEESSSVEEG